MSSVLSHFLLTSTHTMPAPQHSSDSLPLYLNEDDLTPECQELLPSLPKEKGWLSTYLHLYQGFWFTTRHMNGVLACQKHFQAQDSDIILVTTPKSGTTWLKAIMFALVNRTQYPCKTLNHPVLNNNPHELVPFLEIKVFLENKVPDLSSLPKPRLFGTHLPYVSLPQSMKDSKTSKLVYLCRNPKDTFVSLWHFTNKLKPKDKECNGLEESFDKFCRGVSLFGPYWDHVLEYRKASLENPEKVLFLKFEEMKEQPRVQLKKLADFVGCPFSQDEEASGVIDEILELCSFDNLSGLEVNCSGKLTSGEENRTFFRRGEVGDWKNHLTDEMVEKLDCIAQEKFSGWGIEF